MRPVGRYRGGGFTLAELVVLLIILGIIGGAVVPALRVSEPDPLALAAAEISRVLLAGRNAALQGGVPIRLTLDPRSLAYLIEETGDSIAAPVGRGTLALPPGVELVEGRPRVRVQFARTGSAVPDSVTLRSPQGSRVIRVEPWSGAPVPLARPEKSR